MTESGYDIKAKREEKIVRAAQNGKTKTQDSLREKMSKH